MTQKAKTKLTIRQLLKDPLYAKWMTKPPKITVKGVTEPWRVFIQQPDGKWAKKEFFNYVEAYNWMAKNIKNYPDIVIHSKRQAFKPPVVRYQGKKQYWPSPKGYKWCPYCRRPTRFAYFKKHHNQPLAVPWFKRCVVCGIRAENIPTYDSRVPPTVSPVRTAPKPKIRTP